MSARIFNIKNFIRFGRFYRSLKYDVVPVVYGKANYSKLAPDMSYIDVRDFKSARHLADYLNQLEPSFYR